MSINELGSLAEFSSRDDDSNQHNFSDAASDHKRQKTSAGCKVLPSRRVIQAQAPVKDVKVGSLLVAEPFAGGKDGSSWLDSMELGLVDSLEPHDHADAEIPMSSGDCAPWDTNPNPDPGGLSYSPLMW